MNETSWVVVVDGKVVAKDLGLQEAMALATQMGGKAYGARFAAKLPLDLRR